MSYNIISKKSTITDINAVVLTNLLREKLRRGEIDIDNPITIEVFVPVIVQEDPEDEQSEGETE